MKIDLHTHFIPRDCFDMVDAAGQSFGPRIIKDETGQEVIFVDGESLGPLVPQVTDPVARIADMNRLGVDMQAISINPSSIFNDMDADAALALYQKYNNAIAQVARAYPDRFLGVATVPMQDVNKAVKELHRAVLGLGLRAVQILSNVNGKNLDEPEFRAFYRKAQELDAVIFVHPFYVAGAERMQRYYLKNLVGNPMDTAIAAASLMFGGVLRDFPRLRFVLAHGGGAAPYIIGRWQHGYDVLPKCHTTPLPPLDYLDLVYFDTLTHLKPALAYLVEFAGASHVVLGSDYPFIMGDANPVATVRTADGISEEHKHIILESSAAELMRQR